MARLAGAAICLMLPVAAATQTASAPVPADPYIWLENTTSPRSLEWVSRENKHTLGVLEKDPRYARFYRDALSIAEATDRIPEPQIIGPRIFSFWQDAAHLQGIWRSTSLESYLTATPVWRPVLDLDALSARDKQTWVWGDPVCEPRAERRCLASLSAGGEDAATLREFDLDTEAFVTDGFNLPTAKQEVAWASPDSLLVARDWGPGTMSKGGYSLVVKRLRRGARLDQATEVYRGEAGDLATIPVAFVDGQGNQATLILRARTIFELDVYRVTPTGIVKLDLPPKNDVVGLVENKLIVRINQDWQPNIGAPVEAGAIVAIDATHGGAPVIVFAPNAYQSIKNVVVMRDRVVAAIYDNVRGRVWTFAPTGDHWTADRVTLPDNAAINIASADRTTDEVFLTVQGFTVPPALWLMDASTGAARPVKTTPAHFDASRLVTEQFEAKSKDGTQIPYFVVHRKDLSLDGSTPTIMTAYGGFQSMSQTPSYLGIRGKLWLERGGAHVVANIRGGGEFGPAWHEAGLKTKRQVVYDDFAAVGEDLIRRGITSPRRLGIYGASNGGLLMGVEMTERPDLWHAVAIEIPLLDMVRYEQLSAGSSWVGEYGSMIVPAERAFWQKTSPYQALRRGVDYPEPFIWTTTKDDRVGPGQARKFAARMKEYGIPYLFWENTEGGHSDGANLRQSARSTALEMTYFARRLMDQEIGSPKR